MTIVVRQEVPEDVEKVDCVIADAFRAARRSSRTEHLIVRALRSAGELTVSLVAQDGAQVVGHVAVSPVSISGVKTGWHGLGPIAVLSTRQGEGIGSLLMTRALSDLRALGADGCVVLGNPGYYERFGFAVDARLSLPGVPASHFMAIAFRIPVPEGVVSYSRAFEATG